MPVSNTGPSMGLDIACYRGDTFERYIRIKRNGVEENLSGSIFVMQIRSQTALINEISSTPDPIAGRITLERLDGGVLVLEIPNHRMADLPPGTYDYDIQQLYSNEKVRTRIRGTFQIIDDITKKSL